MLNGMRSIGSITPRKMANGTTRYRVRVTNPLGERKSVTLPTLDRAEAFLQAVVDQYGPRRDTTLRAWGETFFELRATDTVHRSVDRERSVWRNHVLTAPFADLPLRSITPGQLNTWVDALMRKPALVDSKKGRVQSKRVLSRSVVKSAVSLLRQALILAQRRGLIESNPCATVSVPKRAKSEEGWTFLSLAEIAWLLGKDYVAATVAVSGVAVELGERAPAWKAGRTGSPPAPRTPHPFKLRPEQRAIFTLAIFTGLRAGELWGLRWCDVDFDKPELFVKRSYTGPTKGGRPRHVPLLPPALAALEAWKKHRPGIGEALVFPAKPRKREDPGNRCHGQGFDAGWPRIARMLGRHVVFHSLRHTCASHLVMGSWREYLNRPLTMREVQAWMGHVSIVTTDRYAHLDPAWLHEALGSARDDGGCTIVERK